MSPNKDTAKRNLRRNSPYDDLKSNNGGKNQKESSITKAEIERIVTAHLKKVDITSIVERVISSHQQKVISEILKGSLMEIGKSNTTSNFANSTGQILSHFGSIIQKTLTRYL